MIDLAANRISTVVVMLQQDFTDDERTRLRQLTIDEAKKLSPTDPAVLTGVALVAIGKK